MTSINSLPTENFWSPPYKKARPEPESPSDSWEDLNSQKLDDAEWESVKRQILATSDKDIHQNLRSFEETLVYLRQVSEKLQKSQQDLQKLGDRVAGALFDHIQKKQLTYIDTYRILKTTTEKLALENDQRREDLQQRTQAATDQWCKNHDLIMKELNPEYESVDEYMEEEAFMAEDNSMEATKTKNDNEDVFDSGIDEATEAKAKATCQAIKAGIEKFAQYLDAFIQDGEAKIVEFEICTRLLFKDNIHRGIEYRSIIEANEKKARSHFDNLKSF